MAARCCQVARLEKAALFVPLVAGDQARGVIKLMDMNRENAFSESDVRLLQTLANSMSVALENARLFDETQRLFKQSEQRAAELAIINSVQEGLAAELDFRAIIDLVGDKIAEIFGTRYMYLALVDKATNLVTMPYWLEHGERFPVEPFPLGSGLTGDVIRTRQPLLITDNLQERAAQLGAKQVGDKDSADTGKSYVGVPILKGEEAFGVIGVYGRHANAFGESDVRLLQTLANSMSVALENARLFDETQRLFKESEQRAAELAIINSVQQALAAELDMQASTTSLATRSARSSATRTSSISASTIRRPICFISPISGRTVDGSGSSLSGSPVSPLMSSERARPCFSTRTSHSNAKSTGPRHCRDCGRRNPESWCRSSSVTRCVRSSTWPTWSGSTRSVLPKFVCWRRLPTRWASHWRMRGYSTKRSAARAKPPRWPKSAATSPRRSTCRR